MSSVPPPVFGPNGFILPDGGAVLAGAKEDINASFEGNLNMADETPQGQLAVTIAAMTEFRNDLFLWFCNQVDPAYASGRMQDAIARIYFLERNPATSTTVTATISGLTGAIIPAGSLALATDGNIYSSTAAVTIPPAGNIDVQFQCNVTGPIACPAGTLNRVYRAVSGWDSVLNAADGSPGADAENRRAFEERRAASVAANALGTLPALRGAVLNVPGVVDAYVTENETGSTATIGGASLVAHSIYVAAVGGSDADVAQAIWSKKSGGANYNGNTTVTVEDRSSGYVPPYPSYAVKFMRPDPVPILFSVEIADGPDVPSNAVDLIRDQIVATFNGANGGERERIGGTVFASRYYCGVAALGSWVRIRAIQIGKVTATADTVNINIDEVPSISASDIAVTAT